MGEIARCGDKNPLPPPLSSLQVNLFPRVGPQPQILISPTVSLSPSLTCLAVGTAVPVNHVPGPWVGTRTLVLVQSFPFFPLTAPEGEREGGKTHLVARGDKKESFARFYDSPPANFTDFTALIRPACQVCLVSM